ncbi:L-serine ammonia-lyase [Sinobacterium caligoides]|uniref:L-serine ammonia-lyase n=1 Tax=Sinobacterium caligoides TaxID=933926 RepID=A0A3N2DZX2_9GAMM|nr:pyridoxal-phosphate dependent enzyme [Sinobacterium caligoides]ROS05327.1 L-serine ammonia-lyase [Sinobacterium caligoides]
MTLHINTPLIESLSVGRGLSAKVWLKMEALQPCGSFKARGVGYACEQYIKEGAKALVSSSGGNAGLAVAYSGRCLGVPVTVVVPKTTKPRAIELIEQEGAQVIVHGDIWQQAHDHAMTLTNAEAAYIHPFDDPYLWHGHASIVDEIAAQGVTPDAIVLSVGGGGLLSGVIAGLKRHGWQEVPVIAVETEGAASLAASATAGKHVAIDAITSVATSLGATIVAERAFELLSEQPVVNHVVTDLEAVNSCRRFLADHRLLVEPACGASLAAVYGECAALQDKQNIVVIVCGGVGASVEQLQAWGEQLSDNG